MKKVVPLLITAAVLFTGCGASNTVLNETVKSTAVPQEVYIFAGKIEANDSVNLVSKIPGKITDIKVAVGSEVKEGDPIIYLDVKDIEAQVRQAEAAVETAKANLNKVQSGARPEQIASAQANLDSAQKTVENVQKNYDRVKQLFDGGYASKQEFEQIEGQLISVKSQYTAAQQQLAMLKNGETKETITAVEAQVKQAESAADYAKTQLANGIILSPISGTVTAKNVNVGEMATPAQPLVTIVNSGQLHVDGYVPVDLLSKIKVGQPVILKISEISDKRFEGVISVINSQVDSRSKSVLVKVTLKDGNDVLKPGMFAEIGLKK